MDVETFLQTKIRAYKSDDCYVEMTIRDAIESGILRVKDLQIEAKQEGDRTFLRLAPAPVYLPADSAAATASYPTSPITLDFPNAKDAADFITGKAFIVPPKPVQLTTEQLVNNLNKTLEGFTPLDG